MNPSTIRRLLGGAVFLFGIWWIWTAFVQPLISFEKGDSDWSDRFFVIAILPLLAIPGAWAAVFGLAFFREATEGNLKAIVGVVVVFLVLWISSSLEAIRPSALSESIWGTVSLLVVTCLAIPFYLVVVRFGLRRMKMGDRKLRSLVGKGVFLLVAWQLWLLLSEVFEEFSPRTEPDGMVREPWLLLGLVVPIGVAVIFYKVACAWLARQQSRASDSLNAGDSSVD